MGLSGSMWSSVSGLLSHGERMSVVSNQIANVNTVGFKGARMDFADFMSSYVGTSAGVGQVGRGVRPGIIMNDFSQGSYETTTSATDVAISGNGFFKVKPTNANSAYYTRAGNFLFDKNGYLTDPNGYVLQGWKIDQQNSQSSSHGGSVLGSSGIVGTGVPTDIHLDTFTCQPKHTNDMVIALNLDSAQGNDKSQNEDNPFFSLLTTWDATKTDAKGNILPLADNARAHAHSIEVFDEGGQSHTLTMYYDRVEKSVLNEITGMEESQIVWEYIVTMDPAEDKRDFDGDGTTLKGTKHAGLLMAGTLNFNSAGQIEDMTSYVPNGSTDSDMGDLSTWVQAPISANGYPLFCPNFSGRTNASNAWENTGAGSVADPTKINPNTDGYLIEFNLGMRSTTGAWQGDAPATIADWTEKSKITEVDMKSNLPNGTLLDNITGTGKIGIVDNGFVYETAGDPPVSTDVRLKLYEGAKPLKSDKTEGSIIPNVGANGKQQGLVGKGGIVHELKTGIAGDHEVVSSKEPKIVYEQKKVGADSVGTNQAVGTGDYIDYIYEQQVIKDNAGNEYYLYKDGTDQYISNGKDSYKRVGGTLDDGFDPSLVTEHKGALPADAKAVADEYKPVASTRPVTTGNILLRHDSNGDPIPLTVSHNYSGMGVGGERQSTASTSFTLNTQGGNFYEHAKYQDGYTYGDLRNINIGTDGVLSGTYSNGVTLQLFQITLYDFSSNQNLHREGNNLFSETRESGIPTSGAPGSGVFGKTDSYSLEGSNVDLSRELVNMITTQRGFQANSKSITTVDTMLETVIGMKR